MSTRLQRLITEMREALTGPEHADLQSLITLVDGVDETDELVGLSNDELRRFKGFRLTLHRAVPMEPDTLLKHVAAHWRAARQAVLKLSIGPKAQAVVDRMIGDGWVG